ncbi:MAG TPA: nicotinate-nucleotide adenylyltransferase [Terriglobales bacterium]|nr:nicotinate-nucleotide adenylyltransferase [Terriglobales bacterium]
MRIGILGGTFNPIHFGHLRSAEEVRIVQKLDRILFIPSASPPHKRGPEVETAEHRLAMVRLAIRGNPAFRLSRIELARTGHSYSIDTLHALRRRHPQARFSFIMGLDTFLEIGTWRRYLELFALCDLIVTSRPSFDLEDAPERLPVAARGEFCYLPKANVLEHLSGHRILFQTITDLSISATAVRALLRRHQSVRYLVPPAVDRYIARHQLYARRNASS